MGLAAHLRSRLRRLPAGVTAAPEAWIARDVRFDLGPGARVVLERGCRVDEGTRFDVASGEVHVGEDAVLGRRCVVLARERISIGCGVRTGDYVMLTDIVAPLDGDVDRPLRLAPPATAPVEIGAGAVLGARACVEAGATVGPGAVLEAGSVAAADIPAGAVQAGVPAGPPRPARPRPRPPRRRGRA